jgi:electron transport complex protein RnfC
MADTFDYSAQPPRPDWGVRAPALKAAATARPIRVAPLPARVTLPLERAGRPTAEPLVRAGERVRTGQCLARSPAGDTVHASISGTVAAIARLPVPGPVPGEGPCIVIAGDGVDEWDAGCRGVPEPLALEPAELLRRIRAGGILGLGGALFPTAVKLDAGVPIRALVINGAECEPWIACDEMLLRERAARVIDGARLMMRASGATHAVIAVETDMPEARIALADALAAQGSVGDIGISVVTAKYPAGAERQLIELVTGLEVPAGGLPRDVGLLCQNVGTAAAVSELIRDGRPLVSRLVTVTGGGVVAPGTFEVRLGTPVADIVAFAGGYRDEPRRLLMGGPMMGFALADDALPVTAATNCIVAALASEIAPPRPEMPCIRCGECVQVCPARLMPHELLVATRTGDAAGAQVFGLDACIECGCCDYVCPSMIPLTAQFVAARRGGLTAPVAAEEGS